MMNALKRIYRRLRPRRASATAQTLLPAELRSMGDTDERDVFVAGYPKSGNTWCQCCIAAIQYGLDIRKTPDELVQTLVPDLHFRRHYLRMSTPTCFKTHHLPQPQYRRVIWLVRDGRDVMTSYYHYLEALGAVKKDDIGDVVVAGKGTASDWHTHTLAWHSNPYAAEVEMVRYEDMLRDPVPVLLRIGAFLGSELSEARANEIAAMTNFESMKRREETLGWSKVNPWPSDRRFIREGKSGGHKTSLSPDIIAAFEAKAGQALSMLGY